MKYSFVLVLALFILTATALSQQSDASLKLATEKDRSDRTAGGKLPTLTAAEHLARGAAYFENRHFPEARAHFQKIIENYPNDSSMSAALFMTGRAFMWERDYERCIPWLDRVSREFPATKDGREGLAFKGACHVRLGRNAEAAKIYEQYTVMYPNGERIESAHLNIIDALREAGDYNQAIIWVNKARVRFAGMPAETNALHALLRMEINRGRWAEAEAAANEMLNGATFSGSLTTIDEVKYLKGLALEKVGRKQQAMDTYGSIPNGLSSYYGGLASERLAKGGAKMHIPDPPTAKQISDSPVMYRSEILAAAGKHKIDPRFVLAIMKQESSFRANAKSPSAARGLLQLVYDRALHYNKKAGFPNLQPDVLYEPGVNIAIGVEYMADLNDQFDGLYEAIAASYNGGEDNAARWLNRSKPKEAGIFTAEVGFAETKAYVTRVMANYRIYRALYDERLQRF
jgi:soluble lytic murein transglycosylase